MLRTAGLGFRHHGRGRAPRHSTRTVPSSPTCRRKLHGSGGRQYQRDGRRRPRRNGWRAAPQTRREIRLCSPGCKMQIRVRTCRACMATFLPGGSVKGPRAPILRGGSSAEHRTDDDDRRLGGGRDLPHSGDRSFASPRGPRRWVPPLRRRRRPHLHVDDG